MASPPDKRPPSAPGEGSLLRLRLRYPDVQTFVERFATNVTRGGVFLASKTPKPPGTLLRFELLLVDGKTRLLRGEGTVSWVREFDEANPNRPCGMGVKFNRLDPDSARLVERIEAFKRDRGLPTELDPGIGSRPTTIPEANLVAAPDEPTVTAMPPSPPAAPSLTPLPDEDYLRLIEADGAALEERVQRALLLARALVPGDLDAQLAALEGDLPAPPPPRPATTLPDPVRAEPPERRSEAKPPEDDSDDDNEPTTLAPLTSFLEERTAVAPRNLLLDTTPELEVEEEGADPLPPPPSAPHIRPFAPDEELSVVSKPPAPVPVPVEDEDTGPEDEDNFNDRTHVAAPPQLDAEPGDDVESVLDAALELALADAAAAAVPERTPPAPAPAPAPPPPRPKEGGFFSKLFKK